MELFKLVRKKNDKNILSKIIKPIFFFQLMGVIKCMQLSVKLVGSFFYPES